MNGLGDVHPINPAEFCLRREDLLPCCMTPLLRYECNNLTAVHLNTWGVSVATGVVVLGACAWVTAGAGSCS
jgi:hypothetical protein